MGSLLLMVGGGGGRRKRQLAEAGSGPRAHARTLTPMTPPCCVRRPCHVLSQTRPHNASVLDFGRASCWRHILSESPILLPVPRAAWLSSSRHVLQLRLRIRIRRRGRRHLLASHDLPRPRYMARLGQIPLHTKQSSAVPCATTRCKLCLQTHGFEFLTFSVAYWTDMGRSQDRESTPPVA